MGRSEPLSAAWRSGGWSIERRRGPASSLLRLDEPPAGSRCARLHRLTRPALVLGSSQSRDAADPVRVAAAGAELVRRSSGGGAVLLAPGRQLWADFFVPAGDSLWDDDVVRAAGWVGELWSSLAAALAGAEPSVHAGGLAADRWGRLVCFAGIGPGEVLIGGRKAVGVSQRRNRRRIVIQTAVRVAAPAEGGRPPCGPEGLDELDLLALTSAEREKGRAALAQRCGALPCDLDAAEASLLEELGAGAEAL